MQFVIKVILVNVLLVVVLLNNTMAQQLIVDTAGINNSRGLNISDLGDEEYYFDSIGISITPPRYFVNKDGGQVFLHIQTSSSMAVDYIGDYPYVMITENMTAEHLSKQGAELIENFELRTNDDYNGMVYVMEFTIKEVEFYRLMYFTGDLNRTFMVVANYPKMFDEIERKAVLQSFQTIKF